MTLAHALRSYEFWLAQYRRIWRSSIITSILNPIFYLGALGVGLGTLVNKSGNAPAGVSYLAYVAPGVLAATAMQIGTVEGSWPVLGSIKWTRGYYAMLATPLGVREVMVGHQLWMATRVATSSAVYLAVIAMFGGIHSPLAILAWPVCVLIGVAFSAPMAAYAAHSDSERSFVAVFRFAIVPMFLFSGTFFPITRLPHGLRELAYLTPLWHGVDLCRGLTLGGIGWLLALGHVAYLLLWAVVGLVLAERSYTARLVR